MFGQISKWVRGKQYRVKMVISMIGQKGRNTIELGDYTDIDEANDKGDVAMKELLAKMPRITVVEDVIIENLFTGQEIKFKADLAMGLTPEQSAKARKQQKQVMQKYFKLAGWQEPKKEASA